MTTLLLAIPLLGCGGDIPPESGPESSGTSTEEPTSPDRPSTQFAPSETKTNEALAEDAVNRFLTAIKSNDVDALMTVTDVPFLLDGTAIVEVEELRSQFAKFLEKGELLSELIFEIHDITAFETIAQSKMSGDVGAFLKDNLHEGDQLVSADLRLPEENPDRHLHYVKIRQGTARIVGLLDVPIRD